MPLIVKKTEFELPKSGVEEFDKPLSELWEHIKTLKADFNVSILEALTEEYDDCRYADYYKRNPDAQYDEIMADAQRPDTLIDFTGREIPAE